MKRAAIVTFCLWVAILSAVPAMALTWRVKSYVFPTEKPQGTSSYVWGRGTHQVLINHVRLIDSAIPFRFRIKRGDLMFDGASLDHCDSVWKWSWQGVFYKECKTYDIQAFCEDGAWSASVTGELDIHPQGGTMFSITPPKMLHCACS